MENIREKRELVGLSQVALAHQAGVSRFRLQLAEAGVLELLPEEVFALSKTLAGRAASLRSALSAQGLVQATA